MIYNLLKSLEIPTSSFHILDCQKGRLYDELNAIADISVFPLDDLPFLRRILRRLSIPAYNRLKRAFGRQIINKIKPDIIYINTVNENEFAQVAVASKCQLITHIHEMDFVVTQRMSDKWMEDLLNKSAVVISPAKAVTRFYENVYRLDRSKIRLLHETVSLSRLLSRPTDNFRSTLYISPETIVVGGSGSVIYRKGIDTFVDACRIVLDSASSASKKIHFVWQGGDFRIFENQMFFKALRASIHRLKMETNFHLIPDTSDMGSYFSEIDIFVLPSRSEAFPLVVLEAMLFEKPVVAMDVGGVREVVDSETGYLVKDRSPEGLAEGILHFINNPDLGKIAGKNGKKRVMENFEAEVQSKKWLDILNSI